MVDFILSKILTFIPVNKTALIAVFLFLAVTISATAAWKVAGWKYGQQIAQMQNAAWQAHIEGLNKKNERDLQQQQIAQARAEAYEVRLTKQKVVTKYITREVIKYVQNDDAGKCDIPNGWVQLHDSAARNSLPGATGPASEPDVASSGITDIEVLVVVTENYQSCHIIRNQLIELQVWARSISGG